MSSAFPAACSYPDMDYRRTPPSQEAVRGVERGVGDRRCLSGCLPTVLRNDTGAETGGTASAPAKSGMLIKKATDLSVQQHPDVCLATLIQQTELESAPGHRGPIVI